ncbi:ATP-dependent DNA helicase [Halanaerobacter jeridensis]|uniref:DNA 5'-3' helicase n=1 Tax=Halanaerobacter jeridensis TaxID=706427 RepID=A0A939BNM6_9FIRM|nr:helicase C-terminal domain-containing protein [Halanaerobacter jeridensis]MBM7555503.1 ATP-dependent DNA helicase DinG [Halanaerobacter jeridensis]
MKQSITEENIKDYFKPQGRLDSFLDDYEYREQQETMALEISRVFKQKKHLLVEAGTGTGKSFAYLVPSILLALAEEEQIVISTNTINLQEQLINQDIPFLQNLYNLNCKAVLAKGRGNYLCLRRFNHYQTASKLSDKEMKQLTKLESWIRNTETGCLSDLNFKVNKQLWGGIASDSRLCLRKKCSNYNYCFFIQARNELEDADIIVSNHHLLFADISLRNKGDFDDQMAVLPHYQRVIFDEAHNIEEIATRYIGSRISSRELIDAIKFLYNPYKNSGDLLQIRAESTVLSLKLKEQVLHKIDQELVPELQNLLERIKSSNPQVENFMKQFNVRNKLRLTAEVREYQLWKDSLAVEFENILFKLVDVQKKLVDLLDILALGEEEFNNYEQLTTMLEQKLQIIREAKEILKEIINFEEENEKVYWLEQHSNSYSLHAAPLNIADQLQEQLLNELETVIFTSATLTVNNSFEFIKNNLGLTSSSVEVLDLGSPFDYKQQLKVGVVKDIVSPKNNKFIGEILNNIKKVVEVMEGRTLILFNSYYRLNQVYSSLEEELEDLKINHLFCQGRKPRQYLIEQFKNTEKSVLLGTDSFWEGVDLPGTQLSCLIIVKLPFSVPSEPFIEAKLESIDQQGGNAFFEYMLPKAVIKFRQGCGRLIRNQRDQGWILVFDKRVINKSYGQLFLNSLAVDNVNIADTSEITKQLSHFANNNFTKIINE